MQTTIQMYTPKGLYGFLANPDGEDLYFHLSVFDPGAYIGEYPVPPIVGERVEAIVEGEKVLQCNRLNTPTEQFGVVKWFDADKGYGFVQREDKEIFLHRSEVLNGRLPIKGRRVSFYMSENAEAPSTRACHVSVLEER